MFKDQFDLNIIIELVNRETSIKLEEYLGVKSTVPR